VVKLGSCQSVLDTRTRSLCFISWFGEINCVVCENRVFHVIASFYKPLIYYFKWRAKRQIRYLILKVSDYLTPETMHCEELYTVT
jgi:hypothetical protein